MTRRRAWGVTLSVAVAACGGSSSSSPPPAQSKYRSYPADHDEHDDELALTSSRGVLEPDQVHAGMAPHSDALSGCYMSRVAGRRWLGGDLVLRWAVDAEGKILDVRVAESDLGAWPVERCLLEVARKMTFEAPRGGPTDFTVPLGFSSVKRADVLSEEESAQAVGEQLSQLDTCTAVTTGTGITGTGTTGTTGTTGLAPRPLLITLYASNRGVLSVGFAAAEGAAEDPAETAAATAAEAAGLPDAWADCAEKVALAWRFPIPPAYAKAGPIKLRLRYAASPD